MSLDSQLVGSVQPRKRRRLLLSVKAGARALSISPRQLQDLATAGDVPSIRLGSRRLFRWPDLRAWVAGGCLSPNLDRQRDKRRIERAAKKAAEGKKRRGNRGE
jgi:hypothetical protein